MRIIGYAGFYFLEDLKLNVSRIVSRTSSIGVGKFNAPCGKDGGRVGVWRGGMLNGGTIFGEQSKYKSGFYMAGKTEIRVVMQI